MKKGLFIFFLLIVFAEPLLADLKDFHFVPRRRRVVFVEDFYKLYRHNLYGDTAAHIANIYYLKKALIAAETNMWWAHPVKSYGYVRYDWANPPHDQDHEAPYSEKHHAKYKELMKMRICLLLTKSYLKLGSRYDSANIYWFNIEYYKDLLKGYGIAETLYKEAQKFWRKTKKYVDVCWQQRKIDLQGIEMDQMEDEVYKIFHMSDERYKREVQDYYNKQNYPEFNYDKIIAEKFKSLDYKRKKVKNLLERSKKK